jgi:hypothetical protein
MRTLLACAVALLAVVPGQAQTLKLTNPRFLYGPLGSERPSTKILPGDSFYLAFDIENAKVNMATGKIRYDMKLELVDSQDRPIFKRDNVNQEALNAFKSSRHPSYATVVIGGDQKPGKYRMRVTVTDRLSKQKATLTKEFQVVRKTFGFVQFQAPAVSFVGTPLPISVRVEGFGRDAKRAPNFSVKMTIFDEKAEHSLSKPVTINIPKDLAEEVRPEDVTSLPLTFTFPLNRAGKFTILLEAEDKAGSPKKTIKFPYKIEVLDPRKYENGK